MNEFDVFSRQLNDQKQTTSNDFELQQLSDDHIATFKTAFHALLHEKLKGIQIEDPRQKSSYILKISRKKAQLVLRPYASNSDVFEYLIESGTLRKNKSLPDLKTFQVFFQFIGKVMRLLREEKTKNTFF